MFESVEMHFLNFKSNLGVWGYPDYLVNKVLAEVKLTKQKVGIWAKTTKSAKRINAFCQTVQSISAQC